MENRCDVAVLESLQFDPSTHRIAAHTLNNHSREREAVVGDLHRALSINRPIEVDRRRPGRAKREL